jgi:2-keto-myo-inositol isomerase
VPIRFALNRTCAPQLPLDQFISLAVSVGVPAVEVRNDVEGRAFADGTPATDVRERPEAAGLSIAFGQRAVTVQRLDPGAREASRSDHRLSRRAGRSGLGLCPVHNPTHGWTEAGAERNLRAGLRHLRPILRCHGIIGYVEPLRMTGSTMRRQDTAVAAVTVIDGWEDDQLCYDRFQFCRCGDARPFPNGSGWRTCPGAPAATLPQPR